MHEIAELLDLPRESGETVTAPSGFSRLDEVVGGFRRVVVNFSKNMLGPGDYEMSVISLRRGLPISQPINVDVKAGGILPWLPWLLGLTSLLIGIVVLALRSAASSTASWGKALGEFFHPRTLTGPLIGGAGGVWVAFNAAYITSDVWFATKAQMALLIGAAVAAVIAVGTAGAITQEGIKKNQGERKLN